MTVDYTEYLERITDAGTRPAFPIPAEPDPDAEYERREERGYEALRGLAVAALTVALSACGAGLPEEIDARPLDVKAACANPQPDGSCLPGVKAGG